MPAWVRVVIVSYNAGGFLEAAVAGLARQTMADFEAVIVDNASTDGSVDRLRLPDSRFRLLRAGHNAGIAGGCNLGAADAETPWLAMLNPDALPAPDWLERLRAATLRWPRAAAFGSTQLMADRPDRLDGGGDTYSIFGIAWRGGFGGLASAVSEDIRVFSPCAAAALYRRDAFGAAGGFAERFFCYLEDVDLGFRLRLRGHSVVQVADARVRHAGSAITGRHSRFTLFHSARNGVSLLVRCMPLALLPLSLALYLAAQAWLATRTPHPAARLAGVAAGLGAGSGLWRERRAIQRERRLSTAAVARLLVWNPRRVSRRDIVPLPRCPGDNRCGEEMAGTIVPPARP